MAVTLFHATVLKHVQVKGHCGCTQEEVYLEYNVRSVVLSFRVLESPGREGQTNLK